MTPLSPLPPSFDGARFREDPEVRELVEQMAQHPGGRAAYNRLLMGLDWLQHAPELLYRQDSRLAEVVGEWPDAVRAFFAPPPVPEWVDPDKLRRAAQIWEENSVSLLFVLFAASLPACYLLRRGIPALYRTGKLAKREYLAQRLYETGLMVDDVLDEDGLQVAEDRAEGRDQLMVMAVRQAGLESDWIWSPAQNAVIRRNPGLGAVAAMDEPTRAKLADAVGKLRPYGTGKQYLWGRGFLAARKVRFLHGYMRYLLLQPDPARGVPEWDPQTMGGLPVNQEDQAYTLLTFGYVMVMALERLGLNLELADREAFLHRWRVVGYIMGIEDGLMTDRWDEAVRWFEAIQAREAGSSAEGEALTSTLLNFLAQLLPDRLGLSLHLPVQFVGLFLGPRADQVLSPEFRQLRRAWIGRVLLVGSCLGMRAYYGIRWLWFHVFPAVPAAVTRQLHTLAEELIQSCWSGFERNPFYLPRDLTDWSRDPAVTQEFVRQIRAWQSRLFNTVLLSIALWIGAVLLIFAAAVLGCLGLWEPAALCGFAGLVAGWGYGAVGHWWVNAIRRQRPVPPDTAGPEAAAPGCRAPIRPVQASNAGAAKGLRSP